MQWYVVKSDESRDEIGNFKGNFFQNLTWQNIIICMTKYRFDQKKLSMSHC